MPRAFRISRRQVLLGGAALIARGIVPVRRAIAGPILARSASFPTGVLAGDPRGRGITLLTRVEDVVDGTHVGLVVAADPGFGRVLVQRLVPIPAATAGISRIPLRSRDLRPGETYWYRFFTRTNESAIGRFRTLRSADADGPVRFAYFSCQAWQAGYFTAHAALAAEPDLDLAMSIGDYIYELTDDTGPPERVDTIGHDHDGFAQTFEDYRAKYRLYQTDANLQSMHAAHSFMALWDNHELADDSPGHLQGRPILVPLAERMENGRRAFWEALPVERAHNDRMGLYRTIRLGTHAELFLLDTHSYAEEPGRYNTYLGARQLRWLIDGLVRSTATWKLIASTTVMMGTDLTPGNPINLNQWDGYPEERRQLMSAILGLGITGVAVLSGDLHTMIAGQVTTTGRADGTPAAVDFTSGAITSNGLIEMLGADPSAAPALEAAGLRTNPHMAFLDLLAKGYGVVEADRSELRITYRSPRSVLTPQSDTYDRVHFRMSPEAPVVHVG